METSIALVQFHVAPGQPDLNLKRMEAFVAEAATAGARIVVFPEDAVTGPLDGQTAFIEQAPTYLLFFQQMAAKYRVDVVPGSWTVREGALLFNTAHYINSDGTLAGVYRKINLWPTEQAALTPGAAVSVFPTAHGLVGLSICWDIAFPALFTEMKRQGAALVISPTYWSYTQQANFDESLENEEIRLTDSLCMVRAFENNMVFAYCNAAGVLDLGGGARSVLSGRSQICHPVHKVLCKADGNAEQMLIGKVELLGQVPLAMTA